MTQRFHGKVALVTGGRTGIGRAIAQRLAAEGARVLTAQRGADEDHEAIAADFSDPEMPARVVDEVVSRAGRLDILVNNVGIMQEADAETTTLAQWQQTLAINLTAPFLTIRAALPHLRQTGGSIVNIGSVEGMAANPNHPAYCASKAGIHGLTRAIAVDHGAQGVRCNAIAPGWIETELNESMIAAQDDPRAFRAGIAQIHPLGRAGRPEDIAALAAFLSSDDAAFITGEVYRADGGRMAKLSTP